VVIAISKSSIDDLNGNWMFLNVTEHQKPIEGYDGVCSWMRLEDGKTNGAFFIEDGDNEAAADAMDHMAETATEMGIACDSYRSAWIHGTKPDSARLTADALAKLAAKVRKGTLHFRISKRGQFVLGKEVWNGPTKKNRATTGKTLSSFQKRLAKLRAN
jgi:hypothetical protein